MSDLDDLLSAASWPHADDGSVDDPGGIQGAGELAPTGPDAPAAGRSAVRAAGLMAVTSLGATALVVAVFAVVWFGILTPVFGQRATSDGSVCSPVTGVCSVLSADRLSTKTGIAIPKDARILASHSVATLKSSEAWGVLCVANPATLVQYAYAAGYLPTGRDVDTFGSTALGEATEVMGRTVPDEISESNQFAIGGRCQGGTRVFLSWFWNG